MKLHADGERFFLRDMRPGDVYTAGDDRVRIVLAVDDRLTFALFDEHGLSSVHTSPLSDLFVEVCTLVRP